MEIKISDKNLNGLSLFSCAGIAEHFLENLGINIIAANELVKERADLYQHLYPKTQMICGDILNKDVFKKIVDSTPSKLDFLIASPPCQGMSVAGKNRNEVQMLKDKRNFLIFKVIELLKLKKPDYAIIENVPEFLKLKLPFKGKLCKITDILLQEFSNKYIIESNVYDAAEYGTAQNRQRTIIKIYNKNATWSSPEKLPQKNVSDVIGNLPSLESGQRSIIKWHFARKHSPEHIEWMRHTPTGQSAIDNPIFYPKKKNGERIKSYNTTYRRIKWDTPAPTITMRNDAISSQLNVHPGRPLGNGLYSDARVLTPLELMLLSSLPKDWGIPDNTPELLIRRCIGECIPPLLIKQIVAKIGK